MSARRVAAIQQAFVHLEAQYGRLSDLNDHASVITADSLTTGCLRDLIEHRACAVRVPGFFSPDASSVLADHFTGGGNSASAAPQDGSTSGAAGGDERVTNWSVSSTRGLESSDVSSMGVPYNVALSSGSDALERYFADAVPTMRRWRSLCPGGLTPVDKLRLELDELWPTGGARVTRDEGGGSGGASGGSGGGGGRPFRPGIGRIMSAAGGQAFSQGFCHVDELAVMSPDRGVFSANVYLRVPPRGAGGHLMIWPCNYGTRWDFYRHADTLSKLLQQDSAAQGELRARLEAAGLVPHVLVPEVGELILICAQRPHAVHGFVDGDRVSMQSFITNTGAGGLTLDS